MHELAFRIVNVFTQDRGRLTGNPLCVFENAAQLDSATMQALARQFNLSETTFILPSSRAAAQVRIFTPSYEMPFAGHPTLGTAHVCRALGLGGNDLRLEMQAGIIPVRADGDRWTLQANAPTWRKCEASRGTLAKMLGLTEADIGAEPLWVKAGKEQLVIPLTSERAVRNVRPDAATFATVLSEDGHSMAYVFAELGRPDRLLSRFFFPVGSAVLEDPATGSATANLGGWMVATGRKLPCNFVISQGEYADRPSTLLLEVDGDGRIFVSGDVVELARGTLRL
jgi:trans-2,3-dihydro-3-hydroxyanthranilate isomerase